MYLCRIFINLIWSWINFYRNVLQEYSLWIVNSMNIYWLLNSDFMNFLLKTQGFGKGVGGGIGMEVQKALFHYFCFLRCSNCWWVKSGGAGQKVQFKISWNYRFLFIQGYEIEFKISYREPRGRKIFLRSLLIC